MFYSFKAITKEEESPEGIFIRVVEPREGLGEMSLAM